jgi:hypothetical protein
MLDTTTSTSPLKRIAKDASETHATNATTALFLGQRRKGWMTTDGSIAASQLNKAAKPSAAAKLHPTANDCPTSATPESTTFSASRDDWSSSTDEEDLARLPGALRRKKALRDRSIGVSGLRLHLLLKRIQLLNACLTSRNAGLQSGHRLTPRHQILFPACKNTLLLGAHKHLPERQIARLLLSFSDRQAARRQIQNRELKSQSSTNFVQYQILKDTRRLQVA